MLVGDYGEDTDHGAVPGTSGRRAYGDAVCPRSRKETGPHAIHDFEGDQTYPRSEDTDFTLNATFDDVRPRL